MTKQRFKYAIIILTVIIVGLLSRKITALPAATGDALYATIMYFIVRFCSLKSKIRKVAIIGWCICFAIELSQLYHAGWINSIRTTLPGRLILGQGFLWSDLLAYVSGIVAAGLMDTFMRRNR
jgi:hypothetical protein